MGGKSGSFSKQQGRISEFTSPVDVSICANVGSSIESKTSVVQTLNVGFTSEVSDYLVVHTGLGVYIWRMIVDNVPSQKADCKFSCLLFFCPLMVAEKMCLLWIQP